MISIADAIEHALPALGRPGAFDTLLAAYSLAAPLWQLAHPPEGLTETYAEEHGPARLELGLRIRAYPADHRDLRRTPHTIQLNWKPSDSPVPDGRVSWVVGAVVGFFRHNALVVEEDLHVVGPGKPQRIAAGPQGWVKVL